MIPHHVTLDYLGSKDYKRPISKRMLLGDACRISAWTWSLNHVGRRCAK